MTNQVYLSLGGLLLGGIGLGSPYFLDSKKYKIVEYCTKPIIKKTLIGGVILCGFLSAHSFFNTFLQNAPAYIQQGLQSQRNNIS